MTRTIKFGFNHMVCPSFTPEQLLTAAAELGAVAVELRNDIGGNSLTDDASARAIGAQAADLGLEIRSINALYPFNCWSDELAAKAEAMARLARACGASGLVLCPLNDGRLTIDSLTIDSLTTDSLARQAGLRAALSGLATILSAYGLKGFVEPLGFPVSSLRRKQEALAAIDDIGGAEIFSLVHDTFHHRGAGEEQLFAARTGLVHISGLDDPMISFTDMRDADRVLVGPADRLGNIDQLRALIDDGFDGIVSFEPFAAAVHDLADPVAAVRASMDYIRDQLNR